MPPLQKKILLAFALLLLLQTGVNFIQYCYELQDGGRFGGDFISFWHAAKMTAQGKFHVIYDTKTSLSAANSERAGADDPLFLYPPYMLLVLWPLGYLTYNQAVILWSLIPLVAYYVLLALIVKNSELRHEDKVSRRGGYFVVFASVTPFLSANLFSGQTSTLVASLFLAACWLWARKPLLAGVIIGVMAIKPQIGVLLPFALIAARQWRMMGMAALTVAVMIAMATTAFTFSIWSEYLQMTQAFGQFIKTGVDDYDKLALSPYISLHALRSMGVSSIAAGCTQVGITLAVIIIIIRVFRDDKAPQDVHFGLLACGSLLATPYAMTYDTPLLALPVVCLLTRIWRKGFQDIVEVSAFAAAITIPYLQVQLLPWHIPSAFLSLMLLFCILLRYYRSESIITFRTQSPNPL